MEVTLKTEYINRISNYLFSDRSRLVKALICLILMIIAGLYNDYIYKRDVIELSDCMADPVKYDGEILEINLDAKIMDITEGSFTLNYRGNIIPVLQSTSGPAEFSIGDYISILGVFHKEGYLEMKKYHIHRFRNLKIVSSLIMALFFPLIFIILFRFDFRKVYFEYK